MHHLAHFVLAIVLVAEASDYHCRLNCDPETGLRRETLVSSTISYKVTSQCAAPTHCDDSTSGTGHKLSSELTDDMIAVERCYSFCYTIVRVASGRAENVSVFVLATYKLWKEPGLHS